METKFVERRIYIGIISALLSIQSHPYPPGDKKSSFLAENGAKMAFHLEIQKILQVAKL